MAGRLFLAFEAAAFAAGFATEAALSAGLAAVIQRNAIQSWKALGADVEVWLVGEEEGVEKAAKELGVGFIPGVLRNESGTPRIDSIFDCVRQKSRADLT